MDTADKKRAPIVHVGCRRSGLYFLRGRRAAAFAVPAWWRATQARQQRPSPSARARHVEQVPRRATTSRPFIAPAPLLRPPANLVSLPPRVSHRHRFPILTRLECSTTRPPMRQGATAGTSATTGDAVPDVRWRRQRRWLPTGPRRGGRREGAAPLPGSGHLRERTRYVAPGTRAPREAGLARPRGRWRAREGAAGDGRPGATRRVQRVARGTVSPPRL